jgi:hypothetical protein
MKQPRVTVTGSNEIPQRSLQHSTIIQPTLQILRQHAAINVRQLYEKQRTDRLPYFHATNVPQRLWTLLNNFLCLAISHVQSYYLHYEHL